MTIFKFPSIEKADKTGLLAIGGDLEVDSLKLAYSQGIFPWPYSDQYPIAWYAPNPRGILDFHEFKINRTLKKFLHKNPFEIRFNTNFHGVIHACASTQNRKEQRGTWITPNMIKAYEDFFQAGYAFSAEAYLENQLVGGLYGVCIDKYFSGESMFYRVPNASKVVILGLIEKLRPEGIHWMDTQMVTPIIAQLGGKEIPRNIFMKKLQESVSARAPTNCLLTSQK